MSYKDKEKEKKNKSQYYQDNKNKTIEKSQQWKKNNPEKAKEITKRYYIKKRKFINDYKLSKGCQVCGYNKCAEALDFHHSNDDKEFGIGNAVIAKGFITIKKEIEKCIVLCRNCHAELHAKLRKERGELSENH